MSESKQPQTKLTEKSYILEAAKSAPTQQNDGKTGSGGTSSSGNQGQTEGSATHDSSAATPSSVTNDDMSQLVQQMDMEEGQQKSSLSQASFNFINSIIGSGVIGMPYAINQAGVFAGIFLMIVVAVVTDYSLLLMVRAGHLSGSYSYQGMMEAAFGRWGFYVLSVLQFVYPVIAMISYNIIVGDTLTKVLGYFMSVSSDTLTVQRQAVVLFATLCVTLPLSLYRDVARMAKISFLSLVSIGIILVSIFIRLGTMDVKVTMDSWSVANPSGMIQAIGVFAFAFMCHHNTFMLYSSIQNTNEQKWGKVTHISIGASLVISLLFSLGGYATFTGNVQGDLLENYCWDDSLINVSRLLFCLTILLTFPLECFVARDVIENICFHGKQPSTTSRHFSITLLIVLAAFVASISTDCLGVVLELNGILAAMPLAYILPALCFIRLEPSPFLSKTKLPAIATALFGTLVSVTGLILLLVNGQSGGNCSHGQPMPYCPSIPSLGHSNDSFIQTSQVANALVFPSNATYNQPH